MLKDITLIIQIITALISCFLYKKYSSSFYRFLVVIIVVSAFVEVWGYYDGTILLIWNIYTILMFVLIYLLFKEILKGKIILLICNILLFFLLLVGLFTLFDDSLFYKLLIVGSVSTSMFSFFYLRQLLLSNEILNYKKLMPFWVSVGFLVFYLPAIPFFTLWEYMKDRDLFFILKILIILMNLFIIYGLLWSKKEEY
ncbi:conserved membrane protein of unknown function [Tenacibaculum sp. 190524A02b]|uniref:hypothetical protein n=1 Tax=Tenacibaculum vairaonense TaxID=3137860 RepID=UPI0032B13C6C